jgi:hypothetical protein
MHLHIFPQLALFSLSLDPFEYIERAILELNAGALALTEESHHSNIDKVQFVEIEEYVGASLFDLHP